MENSGVASENYSDVEYSAKQNQRFLLDLRSRIVDKDNMPMLYTDNGSGFISDVMAGYLENHNIHHIFGTPYHPQGRGKIERFNRSIKERLCLVVYCSPDELKKAAVEAIRTHNARPHESLDNVSPDDVYAGRKEAILQKRQEKKRLTLERRKQYNLSRDINQNNDPEQYQTANLNNAIVSRKV